jgi:hypothetical protein
LRSKAPVLVLFLFAQYFVITRDNLCTCAFVAAVGVALFFGAKHLSHTHTPLCEARLLYLYSSSLHNILLSHEIISVRVLLWLRLVSLSLLLCSVEVCNPTFPLISLYKCFFLFWSSHLWFSIYFFQSCTRSVACPPGISVLDVQVLETSNVLAYINFCCVVLEILCLFSELCSVFALDCVYDTSLMCW